MYVVFKFASNFQIYVHVRINTNNSLYFILQMCPGLQEVNLSSSNIGDVGVTYLIEAIMENEELKELVSCRSSWSVVAAAGQLSLQLVSYR